MFRLKVAEMFAIFCQCLLSLSEFRQMLAKFCRHFPDNGNFAGNQNGTEKLEQKLEQIRTEKVRKLKQKLEKVRS